MDEGYWKRAIKRQVKLAGTYRQYFEPVMNTLAGILARRDAAIEQFNEQGGQVLVEHTNKGGGTYMEQNPALRLINDLNAQALAYWRDLGLTPAGLKRINETAMKEQKKESALEKALKSFGG